VLKYYNFFIITIIYQAAFEQFIKEIFSGKIPFREPCFQADFQHIKLSGADFHFTENKPIFAEIFL